MSEWISVLDRLSDRADWYEVFAPEYSGGSSSSKEKVKNCLFSKWNGSAWSIEKGYYTRKNIVRFWREFDAPKGHAMLFRAKWQEHSNKGWFPQIICFDTEKDFLNSTSHEDILNLPLICNGLENHISYYTNHEVLFMYSPRFNRCVYLPIIVQNKMIYPCDFELHTTSDGHYYYIVAKGE